MLLALGLFFTGVSVYLLVQVFQEEKEGHEGDSAFVDEEVKARQENPSLFLRYSRPFFRRYVLPKVENRAIFENQRKLAKRDLLSAGMLEVLTPDELIAYKFFMIGGMPAFLAFLLWLVEYEMVWYYFPIAAVVGWFYPDQLWLKGIIKERKRQILQSMPFVVDLLSLLLGASMDFVSAIGKVVEKSKPGPLVQELEQVLREIRIGSSRKEALRNMAYRIDMQEVSSFVSVVVAAEESGGDITNTLKQQSEQIRVDRLMRAEKAGAAASQKILFPLLFFLIEVLILIFGPVGLQFL
jgi:tight adherence protein C